MCSSLYLSSHQSSWPKYSSSSKFSSSKDQILHFIKNWVVKFNWMHFTQSNMELYGIVFYCEYKLGENTGSRAVSKSTTVPNANWEYWILLDSWPELANSSLYITHSVLRNDQWIQTILFLQLSATFVWTTEWIVCFDALKMYYIMTGVQELFKHWIWLLLKWLVLVQFA